jgi:hypothetical protein
MHYLVAMTEADPVLWSDPQVGLLEAELAELGQQLGAVEAELLQARTRLEAFTRIHDRLLGPLYAELDEIEAEIAMLVAEDTTLADALRAAEAARERARRSAAAARRWPMTRPNPRRYHRSRPTRSARCTARYECQINVGPDHSDGLRVTLDVEPDRVLAMVQLTAAALDCDQQPVESTPATVTLTPPQP